MAVSAAAVRTGKRTRRFYLGMAIAIAITVFVGFFRSYYLKGWYGAPEMSRVLHLHGALFTTWVLFFVAQTALVASGRTYLHRRMGIAGGVLAAREPLPTSSRSAQDSTVHPNGRAIRCTGQW